MNGSTLYVSTQLPETLDQAGYQTLEYHALSEALPRPIPSRPIQNASIMALCARIQVAAINCDTTHVFVDYAPHTHALYVKVQPAGYSYTAGEHRVDLLNDYVKLADDGAADKLLAIVDQLQRLGVEV